MEAEIRQGCSGCAGAADMNEGVAPAPAAGGPLAGAAIDRRELLKRGGIAAAMVLLAAACGTASDSVTGLGGNLTVKLSDYPQLSANGGVALVNPSVAVVNNNGSYIALSRICPHQGGQIGDAGTFFQCPVHGATFSHTGQWVGGQPTSNMRRLNVTTNADGSLTIS